MRLLLVIGLMLSPLVARADGVGVVGTWKVTALKLDGKARPMDGVLIFTFRDDGTGSMNGKRGKDTMSETFKWWLEADELVVVDQTNTTERSSYKRRGDTLTVTGKTVEMTMRKAK